MNKIRKFQKAGQIPYTQPYISENVSTRIDPSYLMRRRLTPEESEYETRKNNVLGNVFTAPFNKESAQYALEGLGEGMQAVTPEFLREPLAKVGTYLSPLNYLAAISQGSINPKVGEEVVAGWDPRLQLLGRVGEIVYGPKAVKTVGRGVKGIGDLTRTVARQYMYRDQYPVGILSNEPLVAGGYISPEDLTSQTVEKGFVKGNEPTPEVARFAVEEPEYTPGPHLLRNPVQNPAQQAAALDYLEEYPWMKKEVNTKIEPGVSEDWSYPYDVMVRHGLRKPVTTTNRYTRQPVVEQPASQQTFAPYPTRRFSQQPGFSENWDYQLTPEKMSILEYLKPQMNNSSTKGSVSRVKRTKQQYGKERYRSKQLDIDENRRLGNTGPGITKEEKLLTTGDQRAVSPGRKGNDNITKAVVKDAYEYASRQAITEFKKLSLSIQKSREKLSKLPDKNSPQAKQIKQNLKQQERHLVFAVRAHKNEGISGLSKFIKDWKGE